MKQLRLVLLGLAACLVLLLGGRLIYDASRPTGPLIPEIQAENKPDKTQPQSTLPPEQAVVRAALERDIAGLPDYARFFDRLKLTLPGEYETIFNGFAARAERPNADVMVAETVKSLRQSRGIMAAKSTGASLDRIFEMQAKVAKALSVNDTRLCVDFLYGGASEGFHAFSAKNRGLVADMALAGMDAIVEGGQAKIERKPPSDADFALLEKALLDKGLEKAEIDALLDGKTPDPPIESTRMCTAGQIYLETLRNLPDAERSRIYGLAVELMARS